MSWAPPRRADGRSWCGDGHLPADAALADVLYRSPIQQETPPCRAHAESWRRYLERYAVEHPDPELVPVITPLVDHRLPA